MSAPEFQLLTSPLPAAIGAVRCTGAGVRQLLAPRLRPAGPRDASEGPVIWRAELIDLEGEFIDDVLVMAEGDGMAVWLFLHGGPAVVQRCLAELRSAGCHENASTAGLWPTTNWIEEEVLSILRGMTTRAGMEWALWQGALLTAFSAQLEGLSADQRRNCIRPILARRSVVDWFLKPVRIVFVGAPNAGKSTLLNAMSGRSAALTSSTPGTTRDWVEAAGQVCGMPVTWVDTAGLRETDDPLEQAGAQATRKVMESADLVLAVMDATHPVPTGALPDRALRVANKIDLTDGVAPPGWIGVSGLRGRGLDALEFRIVEALGRDLAASEQASAITDRVSAWLESMLG